MPINPMDPQIVDLYDRASFGKQVESFLSSDIGKYLLERAQVDAVTALKDLQHCDPKDYGMVAKLQARSIMFDDFASWLGQAVHDGVESLNLIEDLENEE